MDQNPYAVNEPPVQATVSPEGDYKLDKVATRLRQSLWSATIFLTTFSTSIVCSSLNPSANWLTQVCLGVVGLAYIATIASGLLLAVAVSNDWRAGVVLGLLTVAPCVGMFVLGGICQYAFHLLKQGGLRLTLFGTERQ